MNDNQEKIIEVYKKQLATLQSRVKQVSQPKFLEDLIEKNKKLDEEIQNIQIVNKKLNNEQKLNEIVISKQNKNENEDKANMNLKRMNMDYSKIIRENDKLTKRIEEYKRKEVENESKIKQLQEFVDKLHTIAKDMYNITDYENVKSEEKKEKQKEESKNQYKKRIEILKRKKESNINKYGQELMLNNKQIDKLQKRLIEVEKELQKEEEEKDLRLGITRKKENKDENCVVEENKENKENKETKEKENEQYQNNKLINNINLGTNSRKNSGLKRCKEGIYQELGNKDNLNINMNKDTNEISNSGNAKEIFDSKDLSNINPMNEMSVEVPFVENEDKKIKKPAFLEGFEDDENEKEKENHEENVQKEENNENENKEKNDKGEDVEKKDNENKKEEEKKNENENKNEENGNENIENNIIRVDQREEEDDLEQLEQLEEFQI